MAESEELFTEVASMRDELEEQGAMINALVRASGKDLRDRLLADFAGDPALKEIYLLIDGERSQGQIIKELASKALKGTSRSAVSRKMEDLFHHGLISRVRQTKEGIVYKKSRLDVALGISREISR
jgi:DNA-binding transcriptional ArsR family regulator